MQQAKVLAGDEPGGGQSREGLIQPVVVGLLRPAPSLRAEPGDRGVDCPGQLGVVEIRALAGGQLRDRLEDLIPRLVAASDHEIELGTQVLVHISTRRPGRPR